MGKHPGADVGKELSDGWRPLGPAGCMSLSGVRVVFTGREPTRRPEAVPTMRLPSNMTTARSTGGGGGGGCGKLHAVHVHEIASRFRHSRRIEGEIDNFPTQTAAAHFGGKIPAPQKSKVGINLDCRNNAYWWSHSKMVVGRQTSFDGLLGFA